MSTIIDVLLKRKHSIIENSYGTWARDVLTLKRTHWLLQHPSEKELFLCCGSSFSQHMFTPAEGFEQGFEDTACNATAALNVVSIQYTKETGKALSYAEGIDIMKNSIGDTDEGQVFIKKTDATVTDIASAVGGMAKYINKKQGENIFVGRFWYSKKSSEDYAATYRIDVMDSVNYPSHFVNNEGDNKKDPTKINILDTYDGKHKTRLKTERQMVNEFYYIVPKKQEE